MATPTLTCSHCGAPEIEKNGVVAPCPCGVRAMKPGLPPRVAALHGMVGAVTSLLPRETQEAMAAIADARAKGEPPILPTLPGMNMTERAARAEALAERLSASLACALTAIEWAKCESIIPPDCRKEYDDAQPALDAWSAHRADMETLADAQRGGRE